MSTVAVQAYDPIRLRRLTLWTGRVFSLCATLIVLSSVTAKVTHNPGYVREWGRLGFTEEILTGVGLVQLACLTVYLIPSTSVFGAVLLTGYLGGAIASWVRLGEPYPMMVPLTTAILFWAGLYLREERLHSLVPLRRKPADAGAPLPI